MTFFYKNYRITLRDNQGCIDYLVTCRVTEVDPESKEVNYITYQLTSINTSGGGGEPVKLLRHYEGTPGMVCHRSSCELEAVILSLDIIKTILNTF